MNFIKQKKLLIIIPLLILIIFSISLTVYISIKKPHSISNLFFDKSSVSYNGWLHTDGSALKNQNNDNIQLRGLSSHGIEWYPNPLTYENLKTLKNDWNINVFRIAMYTDSNNSGYIYNSDADYEKVCQIIDWSIELDMYVIVDWHILNDNNPLTHMNESEIFFNSISSKYSKNPNVIYEICNEPNGNNITWERNIKPYSEKIIPVIRANSPKSLIIVGTPDWCKKLEKAADNPLDFENVVYSCHFYSGTHGAELREQIDYCLEKNLPIFVSECGITNASGNGDLYENEFNTWINYLNEKKISWIYWSFSDKDESSAILVPNGTINDLTAAGTFIKNTF